MTKCPKNCSFIKATHPRLNVDEALVDQLIKENPLNNIIISKLINKKTRKSDYKPDPFDINEINAILAESKGELKNLFQFAFFSGLRVSELIGLRWRDIDWANGIIKVEEAVVAKEAKGPKTEAGIREAMLLPPARDALLAQKTYTFKHQNRVFYNPRTQKPWETSQQIRRTAWTYILQRAGVRYRNPYQTRHTFASMMLSQGENIMWVSKQLGHVDVEMVIKTYGRWIPDQSTQTGYRPVHNWGDHLTKTVPIWCRDNENGEKDIDKSTSYMVEAAGIEPATISRNLLIYICLILYWSILGRKWDIFDAFSLTPKIISCDLTFKRINFKQFLDFMQFTL
ncbi:MAG: site-specific integrase [Legionellaceae bacterium]|nr:site-specific integrase [Legionellaceae bacterium]